MTTKVAKEISITAKEWWPASVEEGWGDYTAKCAIQVAASFQSINNCGLSLISHVNGGVASQSGFLRPRDLPTEALRNKYFDQSWGTCRVRELENAFYDFTGKLNSRYQDDIFAAVLEHIRLHGKGFNCFVMTGPVNMHSPTRMGGAGSVYEKDTHISTTWFARQLIERKCGYVVQSPVAVNHVHCSPTDFSLIRTWTWFPEGAYAFKPDKYLGHGKLLTRSALIEKIKEHGNFKTAKMSKYTVEDYVDGHL